MADYVKQVMTINGPVPIDYESLANLPTIDSTVIDGSTNAVQGGAVYNALEGKLDAKDGKAADSLLFGGQSPEYYVSNEDLQKFAEDMGLEVDQNTGAIESLATLLGTKLDADAQAVDSAKLAGEDPSYYATKAAVDAAQQSADDAQTTADAAMSSATTANTVAAEAMPIAGGKAFTGDVQAYSTNRKTSGLRNTEVRKSSTTGALQSTDKIIMVRK